MLYYFLIILLGGADLMAQATIQLPRPTGPYSVGVSTHFVKDMSRSYNGEQGRPLLVRIYYPAIQQDKEYPPYLADTMHLYKEKIVRTSHVSQEDLQYLDEIKDWAMPDAQIYAEQFPFPVLFFSPGFLMAAQLYSSLIEEMASYGYVVVTINHTDACWPVIFPDGSSPIILPEFMTIFSNKERSCLQIFDMAQETWIKDVEFVCAWLRNQSLARFFDFSQMGIFGHSFGGSVAFEAARNMHVFSAVASLDSMLFGPDWDQPCAVPSLCVVAEQQLTHTEALRVGLTIEQCDSLLARQSKRMFDQAQEHAFYVTVKHAEHTSFVDSRIIKSLLFKNRSNPARVIELTRVLLVDFFDHYLRNKKSTVLKEYTDQFSDILIRQK